MALAIMSAVLISATYIASQAFRLSSTARERTQLVNAAIAQSEGIRSFRDNHSWNQFLTGGGAGPLAYSGIRSSSVGRTSCSLPSLSGKQCFSMQIAGGQWAPQPTAAATAGFTLPPGTAVEIYQPPPQNGATDACVVRLEVHYGSPSITSSQWQEGEITVQLTNPYYAGSYGACQP
jgi:hypothetical protein